MRASVSSASLTASLAIRDDSLTWREISLTELESSSDAAATEWTLDDASSAAPATVTARSLVPCAVCVRVVAVASSSVAEDETLSTMCPTVLSNASASWCRSFRRRAAAAPTR